MKLKIACLALVVGTLSVFSCNTSSNPTLPASSDSASAKNYQGFASQQEWGKHLVIITGCSDCHTPKKMSDKGPVNDESLAFSGSKTSG